MFHCTLILIKRTRFLNTMVAQNESGNKILYQVIRLYSENKTEDLSIYLKRKSKILKNLFPDLTKIIPPLTNQKSLSSFRNTRMAHVPVDLDSRLELVKIVNDIHLKFEPVWPASVYKALNQVIAERDNKQQLRKHHLVATKSVIFTGKPGVGKTLAAKWIAYKLKKPLLILDLSAVMSSFLGRTGSNLRNVLDYAKGMECVLLLDEIDAIAKKRDDATDVGELKRLVTVILQEIDEWPEHSLLLAATNHASLLDPAVWRRFDLQIEFPMPNLKQTIAAVNLYLDKEKIKSKEVKNCLIYLLQSSSFNDIERTMMSIRKNAIIKNTSLDSAIMDYFLQKADLGDKNTRIKIAKALVNLGTSQRNASEIVGISRTTLSKRLKK